MIKARIRDQYSEEKKELNIDNIYDFLLIKPEEKNCIVSSDDLTCIDVDTHNQDGFTTELVKVMVDVLPDQLKPDVYFKSHNDGIKLIYINEGHRQKALFSSLYMPKNISGLEIKQDFRHPLSEHSETSGKCSEVFSYELAEEEFRPILHLNGWFDESDAKQYLMDNNLEASKRYGHTKCPISPSDNDNGSISILDQGIYCHSCASSGKSYRGSDRAGWIPFSLLTQEQPLELLNLAKLNIHWAHAKLVLMDTYKHIPEKVLRETYELLIMDKYKVDEAPPFPFIGEFFNVDLPIVFGYEGVLKENQNFNQYEDFKNISRYLPYCRNYNYTVKKKDGPKEWIVSTDPIRTSNVVSGIFNSFKKVKTFRGLDLDKAKSKDYVNVRVRSDSAYPVKLLDKPMALDSAFNHLEKSFPEISLQALQLIIGATLCSSINTLPPNMLFLSGPSGSGKGETINIASSFLEQSAPKINVDSDQENFFRALGSTMASGQSMIVLDEIGKMHFKKVDEFITKILQLSSKISFRPLYSTFVTLDSKFSLFFPTTTIPEGLYNSPECKRRVWHYRLFHRVKDWKASCGGDAIRWRDLSEVNSFVANSIVTHTYIMASKFDFNFDLIALEIGASRLGDDYDSKEIDIVDFFKYSCGLSDNQPKQLIDNTFKESGKWLDLTDETAKAFIAQLLSDPDETNRKYEWYNVKRDLEALPVTTILRDAKVIQNTTNLSIDTRVKGKSVGYRFRHQKGNLRGQWLLNGEIPHKFEETNSPNIVVDTQTNSVDIIEDVFNSDYDLMGGATNGTTNN
ncbi:MAG: hypothetical protein COA79_21165 [Planctomycetota bacterium]|nr:MAG: hypothetical protein COA79_21165 [Planctomycetota bacterium]